MTVATIKRGRELILPDRNSLTHLLGEEIADEDEVRITLRKSGTPEISGSEGAAALKIIFDKLETKLSGIPDSEVESAIDEAMSTIRPTYRS